MSFFDDVINTTKNAAQTAGKKTDEAVRFTKLKIKESQTSGDIKVHFEKLGQMAYEMKKSENPDAALFDAEIEEIDKLYEKLSEISNLLDDLRQEVTCSACGAKLPEKPAPAEEEPVIVEDAHAEEAPAEEKKDEK